MAQTKVQLLQPDLGDVIDFDAGTLYVDSSDNRIGIGTTDPSTKLVISNAGAEGLEVHHASGTVEANAYNRTGDGSRSPFEITAQTFKMQTGNPTLKTGLCQDSVGKVGIGTDSPGKTLDISSTTANVDLRLKTTANSFNSFIFDSARQKDTQFAVIDGHWDGTVVNRIQFVTGSDDTDKDDGYMAFHTRTSGESLKERFRITSGGHIITGGQGSTIEFNNVGDGSFGSVIEIDGSHTTDHHGMLSIVGKTDTNTNVVGRIQFINSQNSNGSSGSNVGSRNIASIEGRIFTSDDNAGDDSGGYLRFVTKTEAGGNAEAMRIDVRRCLRIGNTHTQTTSSDTKRIALGAKGSIWGWTSGNINGCLNLADNYYWDGSNNKAIESDHCAYLTLRSGTLRFGTTSASQTAGNNVSGGIHEQFRITTTGALCFGDTDDSDDGYGQSGQVLTSNGNSSPTWQAGGGGGTTDLLEIMLFT